jgi:hypothetical protein
MAMAAARQNGFDRIASDSGAAVSLEKAVAPGVTDESFDGAAPSKLPFGCPRSLARTLRAMDVGDASLRSDRLNRHRRA